jgi:hypothetical protein
VRNAPAGAVVVDGAQTAVIHADLLMMWISFKKVVSLAEQDGPQAQAGGVLMS